jgi:predicted signal transduction protein with EAL and GGDEF domain
MLVVSHLSPNPTDSQWFVFRVTIALAAACIGAVIPGWISIGLPAIRAGGAIALFVLVYWFNRKRQSKPSVQVMSLVMK